MRVGLGILALGALIALLYYGRIFFITVIIASMIAFLLDPVVLLFMRLRFPRGLASFTVCSIGLLFLYFAGLGLYTESLSMLSDLPAYGERINELVDNAAARVDRFEANIYKTLLPKRFQDLTPPPQQLQPPVTTRGKRNSKQATPEPAPGPPAIQEVRVRPEPTSMVTYISNYLSSFYNVVLMASFVPFLVYFLLSWRDHLRLRFLYLFEGDDRYSAEHAWAGVGDMVRAYVIGNFMLGLVLTLASAILFASVKLPYWLVVAPLSGFLSLVPYIGMPLALAAPTDRSFAGETGNHGLRFHRRQRRAAAPVRAEPVVSEIRRSAGPPEPAGGHGRADVLGNAVGWYRPAARHPDHRRHKGRLR